MSHSLYLTYVNKSNFSLDGKHKTQNFCKWFEPRSISSSYCVIVRVSVVLKRTVFGHWHFDNLSGSHLQSQVISVCQSMLL